MKLDSKWIKSTLFNAGLKQKELSELWDLDSGAVSRTLNGSRIIKPSEASKLAIATQTSLSEVLNRFGHDVEIESNPVTNDLESANKKLKIVIDALVAQIGGAK